MNNVVTMMRKEPVIDETPRWRSPARLALDILVEEADEALSASLAARQIIIDEAVRHHPCPIDVTEWRGYRDAIGLLRSEVKAVGLDSVIKTLDLCGIEWQFCSLTGELTIKTGHRHSALERAISTTTVWINPEVKGFFRKSVVGSMLSYPKALVGKKIPREVPMGRIEYQAIVRIFV